ncbi:MAG TPA: tetratricopeptide repeat protein [Polyangiaceae bacterium]|nr:tetratricopeptide repeat protein [Polyangiaceae bacterium]
MDSTQIDTLVQRLVANPHDEQALATAHQAGVTDPKSYALLLERVGTQSQDPAYASHWLSEAANVWSTTVGDAHRAARILMQAIERDPTQRTAADRLADLYRQKGDVKALAALLERRAKILTPRAAESDEIRLELGVMHEELGRIWSESLSQPKKALEHFQRALEFDGSNVYALYGAREICKHLGQWSEAFELYDREFSLERDPARKVALMRDEAAARRAAGDLPGASRALLRARESGADDPSLQQEYASTVIERITAGEDVPAQERTLATELLVGLAEAFDGEHGLAYSVGALDIEPGHDRALQLYAYYARVLQREQDVGLRYLAYLRANPEGPMASEARWVLAASYEAANQPEEAIQLLEPLRASGDSRATSKLSELYGRVGRRMPTVAPPPPAALTAGNFSAAASPARTKSDRAPEPLERAYALANAGKRDEAYVQFQQVLLHDPSNPDALSWVEDYLRTKREYRALRDVLLAAVRGPTASPELRKEHLREVAALSEGNLRDPAGAIEAWKQLLTLDRSDEVARQSLTRALEKAQRWDELAQLLEHEANLESDLEKKIALEKRLATLHEQKRHDFASAGDAWEHIANLTPDDDHAIATASELYERAGAVDRAAQVIASGASGIEDRAARSALLERLGELRERLHDPAGAGDAYAEAAEPRQSPKLWDAAERCYIAAAQWDTAGNAAIHRSELETTAVAKARHLARAADHFARTGDETRVVANLERATELDPANDDFTQILADRHVAARRWSELVALYNRRADRLSDPVKRVASRRQAARLLGTRLADKAGANEAWHKVLQDGEDEEALEQLIEDAVEREDFETATELLRRLEAVATQVDEKARIALREAELVADGLGDVDAAIARYERILSTLDPSCRPALQAIADLQEAREMPAAAAQALERELKIVSEPSDRGPIAARLARLYEQLGDARQAIGALEIVRAADPDDFDALAHLCELCEQTKQWDKVAELLAQRIEIEADDEEVSALTKRLARVLADELDRGDEALAVLSEPADAGDAGLRAAYVELGDRLGWSGVVASKLVEWWFDSKPGPERTSNLRGAFERFAIVGRNEEAVRVGCEVVRSRGGDAVLARKLEDLAMTTHDLEALEIAHDVLVSELSGSARAHELVRQAEERVKAGAARLDALSHGEQGLTSVAPGDAEELLQRLATIADEASSVIDLYERQIGRCKTPHDRIAALGRASQVAGAFGQFDRAGNLFDIALGGTPNDETVEVLHDAARDADKHMGGIAMRRQLCASLANGGHGARDGGRTRGVLLRRAATIAHRELKDDEQAFAWFGDALVAHVEPQTLDDLEALARELKDPRRAEATLSRALAEVFDGPLVRQLLTRRAKLRRDELHDVPGAAADLKKLHELAPGDAAALEELTMLLTELGDYRAMVQLYEDQILRGKDPQARAELARKVARMWENQLDDPREAADAWRRVIRMKSGDPEATAGLERAKADMLRRPSAPASTDSLEPASGESPTAAGSPSPTRSVSSGPAAGRTELPSLDEAARGSAEHDDALTPAGASTATVARSDRPQAAFPAPSATPAAGTDEHATTDSKTFARSFAEARSSGAGGEADDGEPEDDPEREVSREIPITVEDDDGAQSAAVEETIPGGKTTAELLAATARADAAARGGNPDMHEPASATEDDVTDDVMVADEIAELVDSESAPSDASTEQAPAKGKRTVPPPLRRA